MGHLPTKINKMNQNWEETKNVSYFIRPEVSVFKFYLKASPILFVKLNIIFEYLQISSQCSEESRKCKNIVYNGVNAPALTYPVQ